MHVHQGRIGKHGCHHARWCIHWYARCVAVCHAVAAGVAGEHTCVPSITLHYLCYAIYECAQEGLGGLACAGVAVSVIPGALTLHGLLRMNLNNGQADISEEVAATIRRDFEERNVRVMWIDEVWQLTRLE